MKGGEVQSERAIRGKGLNERPDTTNLTKETIDFVIGFENYQDARRVMNTLPKRMEKYGLNIHPEKTKLVEFRPKGKAKTETIDFLGFTHYWTKSKGGLAVIKRRTTSKGLRKGIKKIEDSCRYNRHKPLKEQFQLMQKKLRGLYQYYGIRSNFKALYTFYQLAKKRWYYWLNRRSQTNSYSWEGYKTLLRHFVLPRPRIIHNNV